MSCGGVLPQQGLADCGKANSSRSHCTTANFMAKRKPKQKANNRSVQSNFWGMVQVVLVASMNKGQLLSAVFGIIMIVLAVKMPPEEVGKIASQLVDIVVLGNFVGYILFALTLLLWCLHNKRERRVSEKELRRVSRLRDELQRQILGDENIVSSRE